MDIKVSLPKPEDTSGKEIKRFLRQMELCVHHLQKSIEEIEKDDTLDDYYIMYRFPEINLYGREQNAKGEALVHVDEEANQMQNIEVEISHS